MSLKKSKSALVSYDRDSDDAYSDEEEDNDNDEKDVDSNSNHGSSSHAEPSIDPTLTDLSQEEIAADFKPESKPDEDDAPPSTRASSTLNYPYIFPDDPQIFIPPLPTKKCSEELERKFLKFYERWIATGFDQNSQIQALKDFRNPSMYEKMISHIGIEEIGTNFPQELYDVHLWGKESYYEELNNAQKLEMDRREKERRERTKIGFTPGVKKLDQLGLGSTLSSEPVVEKRKNRFDQ